MMRRVAVPIGRYFITGLIVLGLLSINGGGSSAAEAPDASERPIIIIDPGHGGHDTGAQGPGGSLEKNITLKFAGALQEILQPAYQVQLTRTGDYGMSLKKRASKANHQGGMLFISIHSGGFMRAGLAGWSVYYFNPNDGGAGSAVSNDGLDRPAGRSMNWRRVQAKFTQTSQALAQTITDHLRRFSDIGRVQSAGTPLLLLEGINMPAVIIETGYLSNPSCEGRLNDSDFLAAAAQCLRDGIDAFFQENLNLE